MDFEGDPRGGGARAAPNLSNCGSALREWREGLIRRCLRDQRILLPMPAVTALVAAELAGLVHGCLVAEELVLLKKGEGRNAPSPKHLCLYSGRPMGWAPGSCDHGGDEVRCEDAMRRGPECDPCETHGDATVDPWVCATMWLSRGSGCLREASGRWAARLVRPRGCGWRGLRGSPAGVPWMAHGLDGARPGWRTNGYAASIAAKVPRTVRMEED